MNYKSCKVSKDAKNFSEFSKQGYNRSSFCQVIKDLLYNELSMESDYSECLDMILVKFHQFFDQNKISGKNKSFNWLIGKAHAKKCLSSDNQDISVLDISSADTNEAETLNIHEELNPLREAFGELCEKEQYDDKLVENYLNAFLNVSSKIVFNPNNNNLNSLLFRRLKTVENLNCLGRIPFNDPELNEKGCSYFSIYSPYVCDSVMRVIHDIADNKNRLYVKSELDMIRQLRFEIYIRQTERAFTRFTSYNHGTGYRATLNRHTGEVISAPYNGLSSIEDIKPLRLFEKIAAYIRREIERLKNKCCDFAKSENKMLHINILIIGHTEMSINHSKSEDDQEYKDERELCDLLNALINWYNRSFVGKFPKLDLCINNIVSEDDAPEAQDVVAQKRYNSVRSVNGNRGKVEVDSCNFIKEFYFTSSELEKICSENDVVFILDCPWLSVESYEIKNNGSLKYFCKELQDDKQLRNIEKDSLDKQWKTVIQKLDTQYNRITSSDTNKAGDIARIFFDGLLRKIQQFAYSANTDKEKEIFIFTSEKDGVNYSLLATYPLTRTELYGGKHFTIARFTNKKSSILPYDDTPIRINIKLWSLLKYISISYAIENMKNVINRFFIKYIKEPENYIEILHDIAILIEVGSSFSNVNISVGFSDRLDMLAEEIGLPAEELSEIKPALHRIILEFIMSLYNGIVFADNDNFGDSIVKTAFEMNVYSSANNVNTMHFLHYYKQAREKCEISKIFRIHWNKEYSNRPIKSTLIQNYEYFMDKKLYSSLFDILETTGDLSIGTKAMLFSSDEIYETNDYMAERILSNIIASCKKYGCDDSELYNNALYALNELP